MASPVAVIPTPDSPTTHMLFFLNGYKQQLAMEVRSTKDTKNYLPFHDNGVPKGVIVNPSSLSAVLSNGIVSVRVVRLSYSQWLVNCPQVHRLWHHTAWRRPHSLLYLHRESVLQPPRGGRWCANHILGRCGLLRPGHGDGLRVLPSTAQVRAYVRNPARGIPFPGY
jgi:hypothetical protein